MAYPGEMLCSMARPVAWDVVEIIPPHLTYFMSIAMREDQFRVVGFCVRWPVSL